MAFLVDTGCTFSSAGAGRQCKKYLQQFPSITVPFFLVNLPAIYCMYCIRNTVLFSTLQWLRILSMKVYLCMIFILTYFPISFE